jgi:alkylhydroperoxidase family enzyme
VHASAADKHAASRDLLERTVLAGEASVSAADRELAFERPADLGGARGAYCARVALDANDVTDGDIAALRAQGLDDVRIFELTVAAAVGEASRQLSSALNALGESQGPA